MKIRRKRTRHIIFMTRKVVHMPCTRVYLVDATILMKMGRIFGSTSSVMVGNALGFVLSLLCGVRCGCM